jgi:hypothetical protein
MRGETPLVPINGSILRLRALQAIGHSVPDLARMLGYASRSPLGSLLYGGQPHVQLATHEAIKALYDRMWNTPGPSAVSVRVAALRRWPLPLDLDDDRIDDPDYRPTDNRLDEVTARRQQREELAERICELEQRGLSAQQISERLGVSSRLVVRRRAAVRLAAA